MQITMRLRLPQDDLTVLDQLCENGHRSEYVRNVLTSYLNDEEKLLAIFKTGIGAFYEQRDYGNDHYSP